MQKRVEIISQTEVCHEDFFQVEAVRLRHERYAGGMTQEIVRYNFKRGDSVAVVLHNPTENSVVLIEQFRYATHKTTGGWILELPAGILKRGESPIEAIKRETLEEVGYQLREVQPISTFYVSPGMSSERIFLFYSEITAEDQVASGGGRPVETEDIRISNVYFHEITAKITSGEIIDAKTLIGLQWLQLHKSSK